jgi:hypothetical protein
VFENERLMARAPHPGNLAGTWLATRAEVAAAPRDHDAPDRPATTTARFAGALVNAEALGGPVARPYPGVSPCIPR